MFQNDVNASTIYCERLDVEDMGQTSCISAQLQMSVTKIANLHRRLKLVGVA